MATGKRERERERERKRGREGEIEGWGEGREALSALVSLLGPECIGVFDRLFVHRVVLAHVGEYLWWHVRRGGNAVLVRSFEAIPFIKPPNAPSGRPQ